MCSPYAVHIADLSSLEVLASETPPKELFTGSFGPIGALFAVATFSRFDGKFPSGGPPKSHPAATFARSPDMSGISSQFSSPRPSAYTEAFEAIILDVDSGRLVASAVRWVLRAAVAQAPVTRPCCSSLQSSHQQRFSFGPMLACC